MPAIESALTPRSTEELRAAEAILASDKEEFERMAKLRLPHNRWTVTDGMRADAIRRARAVLATPLRFEGLTERQVTALILELDDLRRDMRYTAGQAKRNP